VDSKEDSDITVIAAGGLDFISNTDYVNQIIVYEVDNVTPFTSYNILRRWYLNSY